MDLILFLISTSTAIAAFCYGLKYLWGPGARRTKPSPGRIVAVRQTGCFSGPYRQVVLELQVIEDGGKAVGLQATEMLRPTEILQYHPGMIIEVND